ncbi:MAG TPA: DUF4129 domain-containing protein [Lutibacter sp.]|nr:DUF4129 domain-containing protein [Lutibacter sp.]
MTKHFLYILFIFSNLACFSQIDSVNYEKKPIEVKEFNKEKLEGFKSQKDFQYEVVKRESNWFDKALKWVGKRLLEFLQWLFGERRAVGVFKFIVTIFPYIIAVLMVLLLLKIFLNIRTDSIMARSSVISKIKISEDEEIIQNKDIKALIEKALANTNYRLAIRYHYLYILQRLELKQYINWEIQKTNHDYEREITDNQLKNSFKNLTYLYDFVWYGHFSVDEFNYKKAVAQFDRMEGLIE